MMGSPRQALLSDRFSKLIVLRAQHACIHDRFEPGEGRERPRTLCRNKQAWMQAACVCARAHKRAHTLKPANMWLDPLTYPTGPLWGSHRTHNHISYEVVAPSPVSTVTSPKATSASRPSPAPDPKNSARPALGPLHNHAIFAHANIKPIFAYLICTFVCSQSTWGARPALGPLHKRIRRAPTRQAQFEYSMCSCTW